jgi:hypothetical protein
MIVTDNAGLCKICQKKESVILCDGCDIGLCEDCRIFDIWGSGCGNLIPRAFCPTCFDDIDINPYSGKID